jgi:succinyl-CoA synthetase beta subunit
MRSKANATDMLGNTLVTIQTGAGGKQVNRLYITDGADIAKEFYLALLVDRSIGRVAMVASTEGGMDIEEVAHSRPRRSTPSPSIPRPASCRIMAAASPPRSS